MEKNVARAIAVSDPRLRAAIVLPFDMHHSDFSYSNPLCTFYSTFLIELLKLEIWKQLHWTFVVFQSFKIPDTIFDMG